MQRTWTDPKSAELVADLLKIDWTGGSWVATTTANRTIDRAKVVPKTRDVDDQLSLWPMDVTR